MNIYIYIYIYTEPSKIAEVRYLMLHRNNLLEIFVFTGGSEIFITEAKYE